MSLTINISAEQEQLIKTLLAKRQKKQQEFLDPTNLLMMDCPTIESMEKTATEELEDCDSLLKILVAGAIVISGRQQKLLAELVRRRLNSNKDHESVKQMVADGNPCALNVRALKNLKEESKECDKLLKILSAAKAHE